MREANQRKKHCMAWQVVLCAVFGAITIATAQNKEIPCLSLLQSSFGINMTEAGWLSSVYNIMGIVVAFPAVLAVKRIGVRNTCLISIGCGIAGALLGLASSDLILLMLGRIIEGIGAGLISIAVPELITGWFPPEKRGMPTGFWSSWQYIGQAICFSAGAGVAERFGWKGVWILGLCLSCLALILNLLFVRMPSGALQSEEGNKEVGNEKQILGVLTNRSTWLISIAIFCFCVSSFGFISWISLYWEKVLGISMLEANRYVSLFAASSIPMILIVGWILDRVNRKRFCVITFGLYACIAAGGFSLTSSYWLLPFVIGYAFLESAVITSLWTIIAQTVERTSEIGMAIALLTLCSNVGMLVGPPGIGMCVETLGWTATAIAVGVVSFAGGLSVYISKLK